MSSMSSEYVIIEQSPSLKGEVEVAGAKNAVLVIMASLILTSGKSRLYNVPASADVENMQELLSGLGAKIAFDAQTNALEVDTTELHGYTVSPESMKKMRASILVMGPLLARFGRAEVALPGGCVLGARPIDFHLKSFAAMGASLEFQGEFIRASARPVRAAHIVLEYPSVGCTENVLMAATRAHGVTRIINAALEPEVLDLVTVLRKMGAQITILPPATLHIEGVRELRPIEHAIISDRLEAGSLLIATAMSGGSVTIPSIRADILEVFLEKLVEMGHNVTVGKEGLGITLTATSNPRCVSFKTMPYPGFPTDLQAPMMAAQCIASGVSIIHETVYENRLLHVRELQKMGAHISVEGQTATIKGSDALYGTHVIASDIRASAALVAAGLAAQGQTTMTGVHHLRRGYQDLDRKLSMLGARIQVYDRNQSSI